MNYSDLPPSKLVAIIEPQLELARIGAAFGALMDCAAAKAVQLTGADGAVVELVEGSAVVYRAAHGMAEAQLGLRMQIKGSLSGHVLTSRQAATCNDSETDDRVNREACRRVGLRSMAILPMLFGEQAGGVLKLAWREPRPFDQDEVPVGQAIAIARGGHVGVMAVRVRPQRKEVMVELARRLGIECREGDVLARLGVDEFGVILSVAARRSIVQSQVLRFRQSACAEPVSLPDGQKVEPAMSCGSAMFPEDGKAISELLAVARQPD